MSNWKKTYEELLIERKNRDRRMLEQLLPILIEFRQVMDAWVSAEFKGLKDEITHVESLCRRKSSKKRILDFKKELNQIKPGQAGTALQQFDELIDSVKRGSFESPEEAIARVEERFTPVLSLIFSLRKTRERLDLMSDMVCTEQH
jgi:hypothetical protein